MSTRTAGPHTWHLPLPARRSEVARTAVGGFYLAAGGVHVGIVATDPATYAPFADQALFAFVRDGWSEVFMAAPVLWGLALALGEATLGALLLLGGRAARAGWAGVIAFHVALMLFGFWAWLWAVPALLLLVPLARADWPHLSSS